MLGYAVCQFLASAGHEVFTVERRFCRNESRHFLAAVLSFEPEWCVNCIGVAPSGRCDRRLLAEVNTVLPYVCARMLCPRVGFVHASTDGVFCEDRPLRRADEPPDATDAYGRSKRCAEGAVRKYGGRIIRCSIIGPEREPPRSLLGWFLAQESSVVGYVNQLWNGVTTLQWAKICHEIIIGSLTPPQPVIQPGIWPPVTKAELLKRIARQWDHNISISPAHASRTISRSLIPNVPTAALPDQLSELHGWYAASEKRHCRVRP